MWISILRFFFLFLLILQVVIGAVWIEKPQDVSASLGSDVTLTCRVSGDPGYVTWNKDGNTLAVDTSIIGDNNRISIPDDTKYNLVIRNIEKSDDEDYTCTVQNLAEAQKSVTVHLTVLLPPGQPIVTTNDTRPVKVENDVIVLTCSSTGGNPAPAFTWTKNGLVLNTNIVETKVPKGLSSSQFTVHLDYTDHLASYSCSVTNSVNQNNPLSVSTQLQVLYHPKITFSPFKDLSIELGTTGSLSCNVSANPPFTSISWTKDGIPLPTSNSRIDFRPARKEDTGTYQCTTSNTVNGQTKSATETATVDVIYAPIINVPSIYEVNESATLDITCDVDANPKPFTRWQKIDNSIQTNDARLIIDNIKRSHQGNYSCISKNAIKPSGQVQREKESIQYTYLYVRYPPGFSSIAPVEPVYVGDPLTLKCSVSDPGYPSPTYEWRKLDNNLLLPTTTSQLVINGVTLQDNGNYSCTPRNMMGKGGPSTMRVIVNERPSFIDANQDKDTIYNNRTGYWLQCRVRGRPQPIVNWYKNGQPLDTSGKFYTLKETVVKVDTFSFLVTSQVYLQGSDRIGTTTLMISDTGNYTCQETGSKLEHTKELYIYFPPTPTEHQKVAAIADDTAKLSCVGEGYPVPSFVWKRNNAVIASGGRLTIFPPKFISVTKSESILQIERIVGPDFGDYTCEMINQFGKTAKTVTLTVKSKPEPPTGLSCPGKHWDSVTLRWTPGFNGGFDQAFAIKYRSNPPVIGEQTVRDVPINATEFTVRNLFPNTAYEFRICGYNKLGEGDPSNSITVTTNGYTFPIIKETPEFSADHKELTLDLNVNSTFCVKVKVSKNGGQSWTTYMNDDLECFDSNVRLLALKEEGVNKMNITLCLVTRPEVCGNPYSVKISQGSTPDLTETQVIIIGCVCAAILIGLLIALVCIIIRRRNLAKQLPPQTPSNHAANGHVIPPQKPPRGYENTDSEVNRNGYPPFPRLNGNVPLDHDSSYDPEFENEMNRRNANKSNGNYFNEKGDLSFSSSPRSPTKEKQFIDLPPEDRKGDFISGPESGYNTPDNPKPKKVIYEVVV